MNYKVCTSPRCIKYFLLVHHSFRKIKSILNTYFVCSHTDFFSVVLLSFQVNIRIARFQCLPTPKSCRAGLPPESSLSKAFAKKKIADSKRQILHFRSTCKKQEISHKTPNLHWPTISKVVKKPVSWMKLPFTSLFLAPWHLVHTGGALCCSRVPKPALHFSVSFLSVLPQRPQKPGLQRPHRTPGGAADPNAGPAARRGAHLLEQTSSAPELWWCSDTRLAAITGGRGVPNPTRCVWHGSVFLYIELCVFVLMYLQGYTLILVSNLLAIFNFKNTIRICDKFMQGLMEINRESAFTVRCFKVLERSTQNKLHN